MITLMLLAIIPQQSAIIDKCDLVEINHYYNKDTGAKSFDQMIFYDWDTINHRHQVIAWRLLKARTSIRIHRCGINSGCTVRWLDRTTGELRAIHGKLFIETWTTHDPELLERHYLPYEKRRGLSK